GAKDGASQQVEFTHLGVQARSQLLPANAVGGVAITKAGLRFERGPTAGIEGSRRARDPVPLNIEVSVGSQHGDLPRVSVDLEVERSDRVEQHPAEVGNLRADSDSID